MNWPLKIFDYTIIGIIILALILLVMPLFGGINGQTFLALAGLIGMIFLAIVAQFLIKIIEKT